MLYPALVLACLDISGIVFGLAGLAFLGLSIGEGYADWGWLLGMSRDRLLGVVGGHPFQFWYTFVFPADTVVLFVLSWNILCDAIRDAADPRSG